MRFQMVLNHLCSQTRSLFQELTKLNFDANPINLRDPQSESVSTIKELLKSKNDSPFAVTALADSLESADGLAEKMNKLSAVHNTITLSSFVAENQAEKLAIIDDLNLMLGNQLKNFSKTLKENDQKTAVIEFNEQIKQAISESTGRVPITTLQQLQKHLEAFIHYADTSNSSDSYINLENAILHLLPYTMERLKTGLSAVEFSLDDLPTDLTSHWLSNDGLYRVLITPEKDQNDENNLKEFVSQVQSVDNTVSGLPVANEAGGDAVVKAFIQAFSSAFIIITLLLWGIYRSFKQMALVIMPLLLAALLTGAVNVLLNNPFNFANVVALPLLLGMGIKLISASRNLSVKALES